MYVPSNAQPISCINFLSPLIFLLLFYRRAKEKRLKKDAGRQRWSPYFNSRKRGGSDDNDPLDDMSKDSIDGYGSMYSRYFHCSVCESV